MLAFTTAKERLVVVTIFLTGIQAAVEITENQLANETRQDQLPRMPSSDLFSCEVIKFLNTGL